MAISGEEVIGRMVMNYETIIDQMEQKIRDLTEQRDSAYLQLAESKKPVENKEPRVEGTA